MKLLLRLYPREWRARYQDEFLDTVEGRDLSLADTADIIRGAIDAHLDRWMRGPRQVTEPAPRTTSSSRLAALLLLIAGVLLLAPPVAAQVAVLPASAQMNVIGLVSLAFSSTAAVALWLRHAWGEQPARIGDVGLVMVLVSACLTLAIVAVSALFAFQVPALLAMALTLSFNAGWSLLGLAETRRGRLPRLAPLAVALTGAQGSVGPCLALVLALPQGGGTALGIGWALMANPLLAAAWILLALALWSAPARIRRTTSV